MKDRNENSIPRTALTLADNSWRLRKFRTRTLLTEEAGKKVIRKFATTEEAAAFLKAIITLEKTNIEYLKGQFDVLCGHLESDHIKYEYLPYPSLYQKIAHELKEDRFEKADELLRLFVQKVRLLSRLHTCPKEFLLMTTQDTVVDYKVELDCLSHGLLDLIPDNILISRDRWIVIDHEWSFDFPVPVAFVLFRGIKDMVFALQHEIRKCTKKTHPAVGIFTRGLRTYYFPKEWIKYVVDPHISFAQMLRWQMGFRRYVSGSRVETAGRIKKSFRTKSHISTWSLRCNSGIIKSVSHFLKKLPVIRQFVYFFERTLLFFTN
jgi:hypothetical protein